MKKKVSVLVIILATLVVAPAAFAQAPGNPPDTSQNAWPMLPSTSQISNCCDQLLNSKPPVLMAWSFSGGLASKYPSIYKGHYLKPWGEGPGVGTTSLPSTQEPLSWFEKNHPDWLEFTCSASSVSESTAESKNYFASGGTSASNAVPLDVANPTVLSWLENNVWGPIAASGDYQTLSFDNFSMNSGPDNDSCGHYSSTGKWVQEYNTSKDDPAFRTWQISLATNIQNWLRANYPNVGINVNLTWCDCSTETPDALTLLQHVDSWFDEGSFTNGSNGAEKLGSQWQARAQAAEQFAVTQNDVWYSIDKTAAAFASQSHATRQWVLGNYLMFKGGHSGVFTGGCCPSQYGQFLVMPELAKATVGTAIDTYYANQGVYRRDFTNGLVFVNPSSTTSYTVTLPSGITFHDVYGVSYSGKATIAHGAALTLLG